MHVYITDDGKKFIKKDDAIDHQMSIVVPEDIKMPVYYSFEEDGNGDKIYDFDSMANELETRIVKKLNVDCIVEIKER